MMKFKHNQTHTHTHTCIKQVQVHRKIRISYPKNNRTVVCTVVKLNIYCFYSQIRKSQGPKPSLHQSRRVGRATQEETTKVFFLKMDLIAYSLAYSIVDVYI